MIAATNSANGSSSVPPLEPVDKNDYPVTKPIDIGQFKQRFNSMRLEYMSKWYQHDREVSRFINPKRGFFEGYVPNWNAQIDHRLIISGKPRRCVRTLAAGMQSGLSTPSRPWFMPGLPQDPDLEKFSPVKEWLEIVRNTMMRIYGRSNIYHAHHQTYEELGMFGTGAFGLHEDYHTVVRARSYTAGEYFLAVDQQGRVNAFARQFWKTVDNIVQEYGWKNCSDKVRQAYKAGLRDSYVQLQEIHEANTTQIEGKLGFDGMKFRQVTWEINGDPNKALAVGGYNEFPDICPRWDTVTTADTHGVGPGMYSIGDVKSTYRLKKDLLLGINKKVDPPVIINSSVQGTTNLNPGGITRSSSQTPNPGAQAAYQVDISIQEGAEFLQAFYRDLDEEFYTDLFSSMISMPDNDKRTAAEIAARHEEKLLLLGPVLERVFSEMFDPEFDRAFAIANRAGLFPPPPPEIQGMMITPRYISLLAQAQQMVFAAANEKGLAYVGNMAAINPAALDVVNFDEMVRDEFGALGVTAKATRSPDEVAAIREQRAQQEAQAKQEHDLMAATVAAKNLADVKLGQGNAVEHLAGIEPAGNA